MQLSLVIECTPVGLIIVEQRKALSMPVQIWSSSSPWYSPVLSADNSSAQSTCNHNAVQVDPGNAVHMRPQCSPGQSRKRSPQASTMQSRSIHNLSARFIQRRPECSPESVQHAVQAPSLDCILDCMRTACGLKLVLRVFDIDAITKL